MRTLTVGNCATMAACLSPPPPIFTRRVQVLPSKTLFRLLKPTGKRTPITTVAASIRHDNVTVSLTSATTQLLKPPPNPADFLFHVSAFLFLVSAAVSSVVHLRRRLAPHLHRPIAPPRDGPAQWEGGSRRRRIPLISDDHQSDQRKNGDLAQIELLAIGELVLRNGVTRRARSSPSFVDVQMETISIDVINESNDSDRSDASLASEVLLLPEVRTDSTAELLRTNNAVEETFFARIELSVIGELILRNGVARAGLSSSLVDVPMETMSIDVINESSGNASDRSDASIASGVLLLPESRTDSTAELLRTNNAAEEKLYHGSELQRTIPAIAMVAGLMGAFSGGESGGLEMVGFVAVVSLFAYDLLWANKREILWSKLSRINNRERLMSFLFPKRIVVL